MTVSMPNGFVLSQRAPPWRELRALWEFLAEHYNHKRFHALEFGCGATSYVLNQSIDPKDHVSVEIYEPCIQTVKQYVPSIEIVPRWDDIPKREYDVLMVDSCSGSPKNLKPMNPANAIPFRDDAIRYVENMLSPDCLVILHDWAHPSRGWRVHRKYVEDKGYQLLWSFVSKFGFGVYMLPPKEN
jgi:hypothetical protein